VPSARMRMGSPPAGIWGFALAMRSDYQTAGRNRSPVRKLGADLQTACLTGTCRHLQTRPASHAGRFDDVAEATITVLRTSTPIAVQKYQRL